jgi:hypothetical protein
MQTVLVVLCGAVWSAYDAMSTGIEELTDRPEMVAA